MTTSDVDFTCDACGSSEVAVKIAMNVECNLADNKVYSTTVFVPSIHCYACGLTNSFHRRIHDVDVKLKRLLRKAASIGEESEQDYGSCVPEEIGGSRPCVERGGRTPCKSSEPKRCH